MAPTKYPQVVTYWAPTGKDGYDKQTFAAPVSLDVRFESKLEQIISFEGIERISQSQVYSSIDLLEQGWVYLGVSAVADPQTVAGADQILKFGKITNIKGTKAVRRSWLGSKGGA